MKIVVTLFFSFLITQVSLQDQGIIEEQAGNFVVGQGADIATLGQGLIAPFTGAEHIEELEVIDPYNGVTEIEVIPFNGAEIGQGHEMNQLNQVAPLEKDVQDLEIEDAAKLFNQPEGEHLEELEVIDTFDSDEYVGQLGVITPEHLEELEVIDTYNGVSSVEELEVIAPIEEEHLEQLEIADAINLVNQDAKSQGKLGFVIQEKGILTTPDALDAYVIQEEKTPERLIDFNDDLVIQEKEMMVPKNEENIDYNTQINKHRRFQKTANEEPSIVIVLTFIFITFMILLSIIYFQLFAKEEKAKVIISMFENEINVKQQYSRRDIL